MKFLMHQMFSYGQTNKQPNHTYNDKKHSVTTMSDCVYVIYILTIPKYHQVSDMRCTLVDNYIVDHSDVLGASPVGAAPTTSSFST